MGCDTVGARRWRGEFAATSWRWGVSGCEKSHGKAADQESLPRSRPHGYTLGMKTAISIPDEVFDVAEKLARRQGVSRSRLFSDALREYVARHAPDEITDAMNRVVANVGESGADFAVAAARRVLTDEQW